VRYWDLRHTGVRVRIWGSKCPVVFTYIHVARVMIGVIGVIGRWRNMRGVSQSECFKRGRRVDAFGLVLLLRLVL